jgi:pimeloyl-ACP methyl ester carboxylesterase
MSPKRTFSRARKGIGGDGNKGGIAACPPPPNAETLHDGDASRRRGRQRPAPRLDESRYDRQVTRRGQRRRPLPPARGRGGAPRRRRRWWGLLGLAAAGAGLVYLATRDVERAEPEPPAPPLPPPEPDPAAEAAAESSSGQFVDGPAGRLFVHTAGEGGPAVVLVHGLAGTGAHWRPQLAALGAACRVAAPDLRGHGRSATAADGAYDIATHARDLLAVVDALGFERFVLAGHSFGAWVALELAAAHPDRVTALALVDPGGDTSGELSAAVDTALAAVAADPRGEFRLHYREFLHGGKPATSRRVLADLEATAVEALVTGINAAMRYPARARLAAYPGPVLCIAGPLNDNPTSLTRTVPGLATEWLAPTSHWLMLDRPEQTTGLLADLVRSASARS